PSPPVPRFPSTTLFRSTNAGVHRGDLRHYVLTAHDLAEYRVAEVTRAVVEKIVVGDVDEELRGGAVDHRGARHGEGVALVGKTIDRKSTRLNSSHVKTS